MQPWNFEEDQQDDVEADSASPKTKNARREDLKNDEREIALTKYRSAPSKCYPCVPVPQIRTHTQHHDSVTSNTEQIANCRFQQ